MKMGKKVREYKSGDFIFAKVKGYPAWPARVQKQNGKKYFVYFYGTGETANLPPNMIFDYAENKDKFLNKSVKRKDFNDGVKQIEHDFANNVPLEQVIGALAEPEAAPADDTLNESANDTAEDSALDTTAADDTADETANDGPVDSDEAGALVIDEGKQKGRKSTAKPAATPKAKEPKTPRGRPKREEKEEEDEKKEEEIVSRSGRKIKPGKRYMDEHTEENVTLPSPAPKKRRAASPSVEKEKEVKEKPQDRNIKAYNTVQQSELRELKEPFKSADPEKENILIAYLPSGQYCGVKLFQSRPTSFKSEASRLQWDKQAASNAITLKKQLEKGQITPQSISAQLVMDLNLTDDERQALDRDRDLEAKKSRLHFLKTEMKLIELDAKIKTCLSLEKADTELCLKLIDEVLELDLAALMLLKHPTCMETVKRMRVYVGNAPSWEMSEADALNFSKQAHRIRNKADALFITMRDLFHIPEGLSFWELFNERVAQFKAATENLHADKLLEMVHEPIEMSQPTAHTMKAAVIAANAQEAELESDDADKKKKATPAKGKKANSTPSKQPLKRGRKQQQEEKEKEKEATEEKADEPETNKPEENDKTEESEAPKESNENEKSEETEKANEIDKDEADKEVEKVNENSEKNDDKEPDAEEKVVDESEKKADDAKETESSSKDKDDNVETKTNDVDEKMDVDSEKDDKDSKKSKESDKSSDKSKDNGKNKDKPKEEVKNGKDKTPKAGEKRKEKSSEKEKSEEKVDAEEPRAKRSRESKKTEPPPRSPAKRKSRS